MLGGIALEIGLAVVGRGSYGLLIGSFCLGSR